MPHYRVLPSGEFSTTIAVQLPSYFRSFETTDVSLTNSDWNRLDGENCTILWSLVWSQCRRVTDRQTDTSPIAMSCSIIAECYKNHTAFNSKKRLPTSACPRGTVLSHCTAVRMACLAARPLEVRSSTLGPGGLLVHGGKVNAYSENSILGKGRGFDGILFNL